MIYDKPATLTWVANLSATGLYESSFLKIVDTSNPVSNVVNEYKENGINNFTASNYFINTNLLFSITDKQS